MSKMIDVFWADLGQGYDIGCCFKTTINKSSLAPKVYPVNHTCLVGAFHGHAHNCLCQLSFQQPMLRDSDWKTWKVVSDVHLPFLEYMSHYIRLTYPTWTDGDS